VKVLLDECIDWGSARDTVGHEVKTARQMRWTSRDNGELLAPARDVFVAVDQNLSFQRNLGSFSRAVIELLPRTTRLAHLRPLVPKLLQALESPRPGTVQLISQPQPA
jgi:hypothetical protein